MALCSKELGVFEQQVVEEVMPVNNGGELEDDEMLPAKGVELKPVRGDALWDNEDREPVKGLVVHEAEDMLPAEVAASKVGMKSLVRITPTVRLTSSSVNPYSLPWALSKLLMSTILSYRTFHPCPKFCLK